jgi:hypothetical protein
MKWLRLVLLLLSLSAIAIVSVEAKGSFDAVFVGDQRSDFVLDASHVEDLHHFFVFDWESGPVRLPETSAEGYELRRGVWVDGEFVPFDLLIYYPDRPDYIFYAGLLGADGSVCTLCSEYDQQWYEITPDAQAAMNAVIADLEVQSRFHNAFSAIFELLSGIIE